MATPDVLSGVNGWGRDMDVLRRCIGGGQASAGPGRGGSMPLGKDQIWRRETLRTGEPVPTTAPDVLSRTGQQAPSTDTVPITVLVVMPTSVPEGYAVPQRVFAETRSGERIRNRRR
ncbi:hypothetical protein GCM10011366_00470 [Ornithinimicrobium tianjinense]|uniref:Uncharacterized protein n=1 Tax=Ornithinimicrobium tianjinense TaxID=1195761 RepID=A0A917BDS5_9MICO|nr:hypothetical protein GCM10011366_00470 [Ornithinimicrobium tianjinense]